MSQYRLPQEFIELAKVSIGVEALAVYLECFNSQDELSVKGRGGVTSIRSNPEKLQEGATPANFLASDAKYSSVPWCSNGYYLDERPKFTLDPLFHSGAYYVQEASSMFAQLVFDTLKSKDGGFADSPIKVLDLCAAPGGKSTHIASLLDEESLLVSNEVIKSRVVILADNMAKWGAENVVVTNNDPRDFSSIREYFSIVFVDAPCSGEGMFIKDPQAINEWSLANVELCAGRQKRIIQDIWGSLRPGGYLVYSTCTFNHFENDDNLKFMIDEFGAEPVALDLPDNCGIIRTANGGYQFVPGVVKGEGQFMAVVRKPSGEECDGYSCSNLRVKGGKRAEKGGKGAKAGATSQLKGFSYLPDKLYEFTLMGEFVKAYPKGLVNDIKFIEQQLKVVSSGVAAATVKGKDYIPHADLALCRHYAQLLGQSGPCDNGSGDVVPFPVVELTLEQALTFLSKDPLVFDNQPNGYLLLTYKGVGLGFVKNLGTRSNNLLPQARRIRMMH